MRSLPVSWSAIRSDGKRHYRLGAAMYHYQNEVVCFMVKVPVVQACAFLLSRDQKWVFSHLLATFADQFPFWVNLVSG